MGKRRQRRVEPEQAPRRLEADVIRFEVTRLESGLFLHRPVKYVFEVGRQKRRVAATAPR